MSFEYRASDADRDDAAARLRLAAVDGRLDGDELEERLAATYAARTLPELHDITRDLSPPPPAPAPFPPPVPYPAPSPYFAPPPPYYRPAAPTNGLAVAALVLGIVWLYWVGSILAVVFGHVALHQIKRADGRQSGGGLAVAGLALGYVGLGTLTLALIAFGRVW
jgi:hypothetical protein